MSIVRPIITNIITSIIRSVTGGGEQLPTWTLGYNGVDTFGQLDVPWVPTGNNFNLKITGFRRNAPNFSMLVSSLSNPDEYISPRGTGAITVRAIATTTSPTTPLPADSFYVIELIVRGATYDLELDGVVVLNDIAFTSFTMQKIGTYFDNSLWNDGQIHLIEGTDNDDTTNSIRIDNRIQSAIPPTDFAIYNTLKPALGSELVVNGDFATDTDWIKTTASWTIAGGKATKSAGAASLYQNGTGIIEGDNVFVEFEISGFLGGELTPIIKGTSGGAVSGDGIHTVHVKAGTGGREIEFFGNNLFIGSIDNISVKETNVIGTYFNGVYELVET